MLRASPEREFLFLIPSTVPPYFWLRLHRVSALTTVWVLAGAETVGLDELVEDPPPEGIFRTAPILIVSLERPFAAAIARTVDPYRRLIDHRLSPFCTV